MSGRLSLLLLALLLLGCQMQTEILNPATPLNVNGRQLQTISAGNVILDSSLNDKVVGAYHAGVAAIPYYNYTGSKALETEAASAYSANIETELAADGYPLVASENAKLFGTAQQQTAYKIAGIIVDLKYDTFDSVGGVGATAQTTVHWKLLNQLSNSVVFEKSTTGRANGVADKAGAIAGAVRGSFKQLLSDPSFSACLERKS
jgi:hypothetical protein